MDYGMMIGVNTPSTGRLPEGYTELEWIESTGTQYVQLDITPNQNTTFEIDFMPLSEIAGTNYGCVFGARYGSKNREFQLSTFSVSEDATSKGILRLGTNQYNAKLTKGERIQCSLKNGVYATSDGVSTTVSTASFTAPSKLTVFALNSNGTVEQHGKHRLFSLKVNSNEYVPAKRNSNGEIGLYDITNSKFYTNAGTGSFIAGYLMGVSVAREVEQIFVGGEVTSKKYRYIRMTINATRTSSISSMQLSEIQMVSESGAIMPYPTETTVTASVAGYSDAESASKVIDGDVSTKYCAKNTSGATITIDLGEGNGFYPSMYPYWQYVTANDESGRDPVSFSLAISEDGSLYITVDNVTNASITTDRVVVGYKNKLSNVPVVPASLVVREVVEGWCEVDLVARKFFGGLTLYNYGDECTNVTGGWRTTNEANGTATIESTYLNLSVKINGSGGRVSSVRTINAIEITEHHTKLVCEIDIATNNDYVRAILSSNSGDIIIETKSKQTGKFTWEMPISNCVGNYTIVFEAGQSISKIYKVWIE